MISAMPETEREQKNAVRNSILRAYRGQYIASGMRDGRCMGVLIGMINDKQAAQVTTALAPLLQ